ncbi:MULTISPECIES: crotonase/enoyl-CoA hydratase family protein [unclassified Haematobacter]|uniref:crotonase/enoyl-CoA hydratase family protein n=1 Tax=unclassified Haematobacter TaxID=2640585 RepID=UPI0025BB8442|nr:MULTISPECIES: crotonase/enoyl-CoA hydratase family protein [unclassified Haematobacter]
MTETTRPEATRPETTPLETISLEIDARGVATLTLARPERHNALSAQMMDELSEAARRLGEDPSVRVVILAAEGESFCAGGDLGWMREQMRADATQRAREARRLADMLGLLDRLPKPLIGRIQGQAFGGGLGMISVCDTAIGVTGLKLGLTEVRLGLIPATIGPYVVARLGAARARRVFFSPRIFGPEEALSLDLLSRVVPPEELDAAVEAEVAPYLVAAPGAVADSKALVRRLGGGVTPEMVDATIGALVARWETAEAEEGIAAFFEKRPPAWRDA